MSYDVPRDDIGKAFIREAKFRIVDEDGYEVYPSAVRRSNPAEWFDIQRSVDSGPWIKVGSGDSLSQLIPSVDRRNTRHRELPGKRAKQHVPDHWVGRKRPSPLVYTGPRGGQYSDAERTHSIARSEDAGLRIVLGDILVKSGMPPMKFIWPPRGGGWQPIPSPRGGKRGYRRRKSSGGYDYAYPPENSPGTSGYGKPIDKKREAEAGRAARIKPLAGIVRLEASGKAMRLPVGIRVRHKDTPDAPGSYGVVTGWMEGKALIRPPGVPKSAAVRIKFDPKLLAPHPDDLHMVDEAAPKPSETVPQKAPTPTHKKGQPTDKLKHGLTDTDVGEIPLDIIGISNFLDPAGKVREDAPKPIKALLSNPKINPTTKYVMASILAGKDEAALDPATMAAMQAVAMELAALLTREQKLDIIVAMGGVNLKDPAHVEPGEEKIIAKDGRTRGPKAGKKLPKEVKEGMSEADKVRGWKEAQADYFQHGFDFTGKELNTHTFTNLPRPDDPESYIFGAPIGTTVNKILPDGSLTATFFERVPVVGIQGAAVWRKYDNDEDGAVPVGDFSDLPERGTGMVDPETGDHVFDLVTYRVMDPEIKPELSPGSEFASDAEVLEAIIDGKREPRIRGLAYKIVKRDSEDEWGLPTVAYDVVYSGLPKGVNQGIGTFRATKIQQGPGKFAEVWRVTTPDSGAGFTNDTDDPIIVARQNDFNAFLGLVRQGRMDLDGVSTKLRKLDLSLVDEWDPDTPSFAPFTKAVKEGKRGALFDWNKHAGVWMSRRSRGLNAYDTGMGKTLGTIWTLCKLKDEGKIERAIIAAPKTILADWAKEISDSTTMTSMKIVGLSKEKREEAILAWGRGEIDILLTTTETLIPRSKVEKDEEVEVTDSETGKIIVKKVEENDELAPSTARFILDNVDMTKVCTVVDEVHKVKNPDSSTYEAFMKMTKQCPHVYGLSATPQTNTPKDMYGVMSFIHPGLWSSLGDYGKRYCMKIKGKKSGRTKTSYGSWGMGGDIQFQEDTEGFVLTASRSQLGPEHQLPPRTDVMPVIDLNVMQETVLDEFRSGWPKYVATPAGAIQVPLPTTDPLHNDRIRSWVEGQIAAGFEAIKYNPMEMMLRAKQIMNDPYMFMTTTQQHHYAEGKLKGGTKTEAICEAIIGHLKNHGGPGPACTDGAVVFVEHTYHLHSLRMKLELLGVPPERIGLIHGGVEADDRAEIGRKLNEGEIDVIISNSRAAAFGANWQKRASAVGVASMPWSPAEQKQAVERVHRTGQEKPCTVFAPRTTFDLSVEAAQTKKAASLEGALGVQVYGVGQQATSDQTDAILTALGLSDSVTDYITGKGVVARGQVTAAQIQSGHADKVLMGAAEADKVKAVDKSLDPSGYLEIA